MMVGESPGMMVDEAPGLMVGEFAKDVTISPMYNCPKMVTMATTLN